jgi:hypothetical protein
MTGMAAYPMCEAHRDAMASGEINFGIRLFKRVNDLSVTDEDLAQGFSSNSGELVGYVTWATLESTKLPKWQLPPGHRDFNVSEIPSYINGQAGRAHAESFGERQKTDRLIFAIGLLALAVAFTAQNWLGTLPAIFGVHSLCWSVANGDAPWVQGQILTAGLPCSIGGAYTAADATTREDIQYQAKFHTMSDDAKNRLTAVYNNCLQR